MFDVAYNTYTESGNKIYQNPSAKFWFDIDSLNIKFTHLQPLLTDLFDKIDSLLQLKLDRDTYLVYYKKIQNSDNIHSLRLINSNYSVEMDHMENIAVSLKEQTDNLLCVNIDDAVYTKNRQICLPYNGKPKTDKYEKYPKLYNGLKNESCREHLFVDYNYNSGDHTKIQTKCATKYIISLTTGCTPIAYTNKKIEEEKQEINLEEKRVDYTSRIHTILDCSQVIATLKKHLPKSFYSKTKFWIGCLLILKLLKLPEKEIADYLLHSANMSESKQYTLEKNLIFYQNLKPKKYGNKIYSYICNYLNKNQEKYFFMLIHFMEKQIIFPRG